MNPSPTERLSRTERLTNALPLAESRRLLAMPVQALAFWAAIAMPALYVPMLWDGLGANESLLFVGLVLANALALLVGHEYKATPETA